MRKIIYILLGLLWSITISAQNYMPCLPDGVYKTKIDSNFSYNDSTIFEIKRKQYIIKNQNDINKILKIEWIYDCQFRIIDTTKNEEKTIKIKEEKIGVDSLKVAQTYSQDTLKVKEEKLNPKSNIEFANFKTISRSQFSSLFNSLGVPYFQIKRNNKNIYYFSFMQNPHITIYEGTFEKIK